MDIEQMKKDLGGGNVFPIGEENVAFAKYFTGECYLNMLTTERVPVGLVTFAAPCQCFTSGGMFTTSPAFSSRAGFPSS